MGAGQKKETSYREKQRGMKVRDFLSQQLISILTLVFSIVLGFAFGPHGAAFADPPKSGMSGAADGTVSVGNAFVVEEITPSRILPQVFHDQAVSSLPAIYPDGEIVDSERFGEAFGSFYSLVAYRERKDSKTVRLDAVATDYRKAYRLGARVEEKDLGYAVSALLARLPGLFTPGDGSVQPVAWFRANCLPLSDGYADSPEKKVECRVNRFGELGRFGDSLHYFALYRWLVRFGNDDAGAGGMYDVPPYNSTAVVILADPAGEAGASPLLSFRNDGMIGVSWFVDPEVVENGYGKILVIPERLTGTGAGTDARYLIWTRGRWKRIESDSWRRDLQARLPDRHGIRKGIPVDIRNMRFESPLWRDGDANCCPTGGNVRVELIIRDGRLEIGNIVRIPP